MLSFRAKPKPPSRRSPLEAHPLKRQEPRWRWETCPGVYLLESYGLTTTLLDTYSTWLPTTPPNRPTYLATSTSWLASSVDQNTRLPTITHPIELLPQMVVPRQQPAGETWISTMDHTWRSSLYRYKPPYLLTRLPTYLPTYLPELVATNT